MKMKCSIIAGYTCWCGLGFYRGVKYYNYTYNRYNKDEPYLYLYSIGEGIFGTFTYVLPPFIPFTLYKELYRLEVNIRNLEKDRKYYNLI